MAACGDGDVDPAPGSDLATEEGPPPELANVDVPNACTFFTRAELEQAVGYELRDGEAEDAPPPASACDFETPPGIAVTRTYPNPPLPPSVGFSSLTINTYPSTQADFEEGQRLIGADAENLPGIG